MNPFELDPTTRHIDPDFARKLRETKLACKESAGWQCEHMHPNGQRCKAREGQLCRKQGRHGRPDSWTVVHLHACHLDSDPTNPQPRMICLCARHHMAFDWGTELTEQPGVKYRKGYHLTTTDALLEEINSTGSISVWEEADGYHWRVDGTNITGKRTTAVGAVGTAIYHLRWYYEQSSTSQA